MVVQLLSSDYVARVRREVGEHEIEDHVEMKALAIKYLNGKYDVELEKITCTCEVGDKVIGVYSSRKRI
jgi:hypothetical protein